MSLKTVGFVLTVVVVVVFFLVLVGLCGFPAQIRQRRPLAYSLRDIPMNESPLSIPQLSSSHHPSCRLAAIGLLVALLLLGGAAGLVVRSSFGPTVSISGHRWALYPSSGRSPELDSSTEQEKLAFHGNVKLFSLLYTEVLANGQNEEIREALRHVLIDLPPQGHLACHRRRGIGCGQL